MGIGPPNPEALAHLLVAPWRRWYVFFPVLVCVPCTLFAWRALAAGRPASGGAADAWVWAGGALAGLFLATFLAWTFEAFDPRLARRADAARTLGWNLLAEIPYDEGVAATGKDPGRLAPGNRAAYEHLATEIVRLAEECELRTFAVTSSRAGEGRTSTAIHLAAVLSRWDYRVILVDTCFESPDVHRHFGLANESGLSDLLEAVEIDRECPGAGFARQEESFDQALRPTAIEGLQIISAGKKPDLSPKYSEKESFQPFVHQMRRHADIVIVDTPAINSQSAALSCTASVDGCLFIVEAGRTPRVEALRAREQLKMDRASVVGVLFNHTHRPAFWHEPYAEVRRPASAGSSPTRIRQGVNQS